MFVANGEDADFSLYSSQLNLKIERAAEASTIDVEQASDFSQKLSPGLLSGCWIDTMYRLSAK